MSFISRQVTRLFVSLKTLPKFYASSPFARMSTVDKVKQAKNAINILKQQRSDLLALKEKLRKQDASLDLQLVQNERETQRLEDAIPKITKLTTRNK